MATPRLAAHSTPSPPPTIHTPPTPRLGFGDSWEPFSPRKSSRLSARAAVAGTSSAAGARTPSPSAATRRSTRQLRSPRITKQQQERQQQQQPATHDRAISPAPTPRKKQSSSSSAMMGNNSRHQHHHLSPSTASRRKTTAVSMLPTPAKTPSKKHHAASENKSNIAAIARNLFHSDGEVDAAEDDEGNDDVDELMASPSKKPKQLQQLQQQQKKKYTGISLESFTAIEDDEPIPIFTDSQDRVPEADFSADNPFYGAGAAAPPVEPVRLRRSRRNLVSIPGEGRLTVEEAARREDGIVYVFRGKKIFRKFEDAEAAQEEDILEGRSSGRRTTRSAIRPRLLFPREELRAAALARQTGGTTEDEEADTDIEDHVLEAEAQKAKAKAKAAEEEEDAVMEEAEPAVEVETEETEAATPKASIEKKPTAPNTPPRAPKYALASPPVTGRTTRSGHKAVEEATPSRSTRSKKRSPFDSWRQTKSSAGVAGHKRHVEEPLGTAVSSKRTRA